MFYMLRENQSNAWSGIDRELIVGAVAISSATPHIVRRSIFYEKKEKARL
jgi:hypothetical protein